MDLTHYFTPVSLDKPAITYLSQEDTFSHHIAIHTPNHTVPDLTNIHVALIGVPEERNSINTGCAKAPDAIRNKLYQLSYHTPHLNIADLGNVIAGQTLNDTIYALKDVLSELHHNNITTILMGGGQHLLYALYLYYSHAAHQMNLLTIDAKPDMDTEENLALTSENYLHKIITEDQGSTLFDYVNLGHQIYFNTQKKLDYLKDLLYTSLRLGTVRSNLAEAEPYIRDANVIGIDANAVRQSESPGNIRPSPNGYQAEEICQLAKYAGISNNLTNFGIYEVNPDYDRNHQSSHLFAQTIWYFLDGLSQRERHSSFQPSEIKKFIVSLNKDLTQEIIFHQNTLTDQWWAEIPMPAEGTKRIIACSYHDYRLACNSEIPDRWLRIFQKFH